MQDIHLINLRSLDFTPAQMVLTESESSYKKILELGLNHHIPLSNSWEIREYRKVDPKGQLGDFFSLSTIWCMGISAKAASLSDLRNKLESSGELLPILIQDEMHFIWHPIKESMELVSIEISKRSHDGGVETPAFIPDAICGDWVFSIRHMLFVPDLDGIAAFAEKHGLRGLSLERWKHPNLSWAQHRGKPEYAILPNQAKEAEQLAAANADHARKEWLTKRGPRSGPTPGAEDGPVFDGVARLKYARAALFPALEAAMEDFLRDYPEAVVQTVGVDVQPAYGYFDLGLSDEPAEADDYVRSVELKYRSYEPRSTSPFMKAIEEAHMEDDYRVELFDGTLIDWNVDGYEAYEKAVLDGIAEVVRDFFASDRAKIKPRWIIVENDTEHFHRWERLADGTLVESL